MAREWNELGRPLRLGVYGFWGGFTPRTSPLVGLLESVVKVEFTPLSTDTQDVVLTSVFGGMRPDFLEDRFTMQYIGEPKALFPPSLRWGDYHLSFQPDSANTFWLPHWLHDMLKYDYNTKTLTFTDTKRPSVPKTEFAAIYASHDKFGTREPIVAALNQYKEVHCFGTWRNNKQQDYARNDEQNRSALKMATLDRYKFPLAIENTREPYYTTEKLSEAAFTGIPIYWGDPVLDQGPFNRKRLIDASTLSSQELLEQVILLDTDTTMYDRMVNLPIFHRPVFPTGLAARSDVLLRRILEETS